jgi:3-methyladenine DNA glycosylase AlkD
MKDETICEECEEWMGESEDMVEWKKKFMCRECARKNGWTD